MLQPRSWRFLILSLLGLCVWALVSESLAAQTPPDAVIEAEQRPQQGDFWWDLLDSLVTFNSGKLMEILGRPNFTVAAFLALNLIVFVETGLLIGFFLPGDSLLVTAGIICYASQWNLPLLLVTLCVSAIIGDTVGYAIGYNTGPKIFTREKSLFFNRDHLLVAQAFYERHGGKTIVLARFMPIIRTFAPVVAGVGRMSYRKFLFFNVFGGISWVVSMILIGYFLTRAIDPIFHNWLGFDTSFTVRHHIEKVIIIVVFLSISPGLYVWLKQWLKGKPAEAEVSKSGV